MAFLPFRADAVSAEKNRRCADIQTGSRCGFPSTHEDTLTSYCFVPAGPGVTGITLPVFSLELSLTPLFFCPQYAQCQFRFPDLFNRHIHQSYDLETNARLRALPRDATVTEPPNPHPHF